MLWIIGKPNGCAFHWVFFYIKFYKMLLFILPFILLILKALLHFFCLFVFIRDHLSNSMFSRVFCTNFKEDVFLWMYNETMKCVLMTTVSIPINPFTQLPLATTCCPITCPNKLTSGFCFSRSCVLAASSTFRTLVSVTGFKDLTQVQSTIWSTLGGITLGYRCIH